jgi:hypothetical protein
MPDYQELLERLRDSYNRRDPDAFEDLDEMFEEMRVELDQYRRVGDRLLVLGGMTAKGRGSGS